MKRALIVCGCAALLCCWTQATYSADTSSDSVLGHMRPAFDLPDLHDNSVSISRWNGRVIVLNFWATWCGPCRKEIPLLNTLQKAYSARGVQIVGVALDNTEAIKQFMRSVPINYPVLVGDQNAIEVIEAYGDSAGALPYTVFIDKKGIIVNAASGALTDDYARKTIEGLLTNR